MPPIDQHVHEFLSRWGWTAEATVKLLLAAICGALVGIEREMSGRVAGFRTNLLVCLGSALVMLVSLRIAFSQDYSAHAPGMSVVNDPALFAKAKADVIAALGADGFRDLAEPPAGFSEDFGLFQEQIPGVFFFVGASSPGRVAAPHSPNFD